MKTDCDPSQKISLFVLCCCFSIYFVVFLFVCFFNKMGGFRGGEGRGGEGARGGPRSPFFLNVYFFESVTQPSSFSSECFMSCCYMECDLAAIFTAPFS